MKKLNIPVGISDFAKIRDRKYYYVDKTKLISDLLEEDGGSDSYHPPPSLRQNDGDEHALSLLRHPQGQQGDVPGLKNL